MTDTRTGRFRSPMTRRSFLRRAGVGSAAVLGGTLWAGKAAGAARPLAARLPIEHVIISCQENRSFDHYYGYAPQVQAAGFGPPPGYSQPDGRGGSVFPFEFTSLTTADIGHSWSAVHNEYDG